MEVLRRIDLDPGVKESNSWDGVFLDNECEWELNGWIFGGTITQSNNSNKAWD